MRKKPLILVGMVLLLGCLVLGFSSAALAEDGVYRSMLKTGGVLAAILGIIGIAVAGYSAGKSYDSYTGWERHNLGAGQFYNRKPFRKDSPTYGITEQTIRLKWEENWFNRLRTIGDLLRPPDGGEPKWTPAMGIEKLPEPLKSFFVKQPERYKLTLKAFELMKLQKANWASRLSLTFHRRNGIFEVFAGISHSHSKAPGMPLNLSRRSLTPLAPRWWGSQN
jgi:hypothetical protein